ncbi:MAG: DNA-directed RNA polymerase subunit RpoH/Rpb5 C-terminal domain-containing protein [Cuniculiplasma sp.]
MSKFNVLHHELVPEHYLVDEKDESSILKKLQTEKSKLPKINVTDPAIKALMELHGDIGPNRIIKIVRKNPNVGITEYYRITASEVFK